MKIKHETDKDEAIYRLSQYEGRWAEIANDIRYSRSWIYKLGKGQIPNPGGDGLKAVITWCKKHRPKK